MTMLRLDDSIKKRTKYCMQTYRLKTVDAIIVATAIVHNLILVTADVQLEKVAEVDILLYKP
jgi:predicted nucleic acid-binding protein